MEGYASKLIVRIDGMLPGILNNREINGEIEQYKANFTVTDNTIYGFKNLLVETQTNIGLEPVRSVKSGLPHSVQIYGEFIFNLFFHRLWTIAILLSRRL